MKSNWKIISPMKKYKYNVIKIKPHITSFTRQVILGLLGFNIWHCLNPKVFLLGCLGMSRKTPRQPFNSSRM